MPNKDNLKSQPINGQPSGLAYHSSRRLSATIIKLIAALFVFFLIVALSLVFWINVQLSPIDEKSTESISLTVESGSTSFEISDALEKKMIIRSSTAFDLYVRFIDRNSILQAGKYKFSPSESVKQIVDRLKRGDVEKFKVTFFPGATLIDNRITQDNKKYDVTTVLRRAGFSDSEIDLALTKTYASPVFKDKPDGSDLEGYIFGETYSFNSGTKVENIIQSAIDEFYAVVQKNNLIDAFSRQGLNLYEGITLASIVQREANTNDDQRRVAQVFYSRLRSGMSLGSDVTYQYIADKLGVERDTNLDSPYNTRRYEGLPPGPIATPSLSALLAVANPAEGESLYFLAGDDGIVYYAKTQSEHEKNIINHCQVGCSVL